MAVLIENSTDHVSKREGEHRPAVAGGPIRNRKAGARTGDEAAGNNQKNRGSGNEFRVTVQPHGVGSGFSVPGSGFRFWRTRTLNPETLNVDRRALVPGRGPTFEGEVLFLLFLGGKRDLLRLRAEFFLPRGKRVAARRQAFDRERAV